MKRNPYAKKYTLANLTDLSEEIDPINIKDEDWTDDTDNTQKTQKIQKYKSIPMKTRRQKARFSILPEGRKCVICATNNSPQWRYVGGAPRCNACGLYYINQVKEEAILKKTYIPRKLIFPTDFLENK